MKRAFGDSFFFIALLNPRDNYHQRTVALNELVDALTGDRHFAQAGFKLLLEIAG